MKAAVITSIGNPPELGERPQPRGGTDDQVLVQVSTAALNPVDLLIASGGHPIGRPQVPYVPGVEGVGTVVAGGRLRPGTRVRVQVAAGLVDGTLGELVSVPAEACCEIPDSLPDKAAAAIGVVGVSAYLGLRSARLAEGESVLVLGAAGGLGQAVIRAARAFGAARVIAAGRDARRLAALDGADEYVTLDHADLREQLSAPVDVVADPLWGPWAEPAMRCLAPGGRYLNYGSLAGGTSPVDAHLLRAGRLSIVGFSGASVSAGDAAIAYRAIAELAAAGRFTVATECYELTDVAAAWTRQVDSPGAKILITPGSLPPRTR